MAEQDPSVGGSIYDGGGVHGASCGSAGGRDAADELGLPVPQSTIIREDSKACQLFADDAGNFNRTKHIDVRYYFVRECIAKGSVRVDYVATAENGRTSSLRSYQENPSSISGHVKINGQVKLEDTTTCKFLRLIAFVYPIWRLSVKI